MPSSTSNNNNNTSVSTDGLPSRKRTLVGQLLHKIAAYKQTINLYRKQGKNSVQLELKIRSLEAEVEKILSACKEKKKTKKKNKKVQRPFSASYDVAGAAAGG